jgi:FtsX-like permease family/MacB-like periplasmic core domain
VTQRLTEDAPMSSSPARIVWYRFRVTLRYRWPGYLSIVLLVGLMGGVAIGAIAAARRTQSSFSVFLASTSPSDLSIPTYGAAASGANYSPSLTREISQLPGVKHVEAWISVNAAPLLPNGSPDPSHIAQIYPAASVDGLYFNQDRVAVTQGRMANPRRADEVVMTAEAAQLLGLHVGQTVPYGIFSNEQFSLPGFGTPRVKPYRRIDARLVGLVVLNSQVVQDEVDRLPGLVLFTPALARELLADSGRGASGAVYYGLQLSHGSQAVAQAEQEFAHLPLSRGAEYNFHTIAPVEAKVDRAIQPLALALAAFGAIAALAAVLVAVQAISRQLSAASHDMTILRALGAGPAANVADGLLGLIGALILGSLLADVVAVALSPLSPIGPVRPIYPSPGVAFDWPVLGAGPLFLIGGIGSIAVVLAYRDLPHRVWLRSRIAPARSSKAVQAASSIGLSAAGTVGVRFALERGERPASAPVRSALLGAVLAVGMVSAALTFGSGLGTLVSHPPLYGWNWDFMLNASNNVPPQALALLGRDHDVAAWTGVDHGTAQIDGQNVPVLLGQARAAISPAILAGHPVLQDNQIVLGAATLAQLHKHIGDVVDVSSAGIPRTPVVIVGTATMPAVGSSGIFADHPSMGIGALMSADIESAAYRQAQLSRDPTLNGPQLVFIQLRKGVDPAAGQASLQEIATAANRAFAAVPDAAGSGDTVAVQGVQRPAEIVNYRDMGAAPVILAAGVAGGALAALALTLAASVRRRRRDLALLKALGFTRAQLAAAVMWQASVATVIGIVIGVPAGIALGRSLWVVFARAIYAVPEPTVPVLLVVLIGLGALVLANGTAAMPARIAARTPAAGLLRAP